MIIDRHEVIRITEDIWSVMVGVITAPMPAGGDHPPPDASVSGRVGIVGDWSGVVVVDCPLQLAQRVAAVMFCIEPSEVNDDELDDAIGELANMTGGNLKAILLGDHDLTLPWVVRGGSAPDLPVVERVVFECDGAPFAVTAFDGEHDNEPTRSPR